MKSRVTIRIAAFLALSSFALLVGNEGFHGHEKTLRDQSCSVCKVLSTTFTVSAPSSTHLSVFLREIGECRIDPFLSSSAAVASFSSIRAPPLN
jgi:hypothetical protein